MASYLFILILISVRSKLHVGCGTPLVMQYLYSFIMTARGGAEVEKEQKKKKKDKRVQGDYFFCVCLL